MQATDFSENGAIPLKFYLQENYGTLNSYLYYRHQNLYILYIKNVPQKNVYKLFLDSILMIYYGGVYHSLVHILLEEQAFTSLASDHSTRQAKRTECWVAPF